MCAIHSDFSVAVVAYTAKDLEAVQISQPFLYAAVVGEQNIIQHLFVLRIQ